MCTSSSGRSGVMCMYRGMVFDVLCPLRRQPFQKGYSNELESADAVLAGHYNEGGSIECYVVLNGLPDVSVRLQVLIVDVPNAVLMCAAWCCVCRRGGDVLRVLACWVAPHVAV